MRVLSHRTIIKWLAHSNANEVLYSSFTLSFPKFVTLNDDGGHWLSTHFFLLSVLNYNVGATGRTSGSLDRVAWRPHSRPHLGRPQDWLAVSGRGVLSIGFFTYLNPSFLLSLFP